MGGKAHAARMRNPLGVGHDQVGQRLQLAQRLQHGRNLAEAEQAGDVRVHDRPAPEGMVEQFQAGEGQHGDGGLHLVGVHADVHAGNCARRLRQRRLHDQAGQPALDLDSLAGRNIPCVRMVQDQVHGR